MTNLTLCFFFADLGDPWWKTAVTEMLRSARRVMPDAKIVQLSPRGTAMHPWADELVEANLGDPAPDVASILSKVKAYLIAEYAAATPGPVIFCDADVIWKAAPPIYQPGAVAWDETAEALEMRQFYIQKGTTDWPWGRFKRVLDALPLSCLAKDAAELALNMNFLPGDALSLSAADTLEFMVHFPGARDEMIAFARSLDGGEPFKEMDPGYVPPLPPRKEGLSQPLDLITFNADAPLTIPSEMMMKLQEQAAFALPSRAVEGAEAV